MTSVVEQPTASVLSLTRTGPLQRIDFKSVAMWRRYNGTESGWYGDWPFQSGETSRKCYNKGWHIVAREARQWRILSIGLPSWSVGYVKKSLICECVHFVCVSFDFIWGVLNFSCKRENIMSWFSENRIFVWFLLRTVTNVALIDWTQKWHNETYYTVIWIKVNFVYLRSNREYSWQCNVF